MGEMMSMSRKIVFLLVITLAYLYIQANWLQVSMYRVPLPEGLVNPEGIRILQLSDLHSKTFGRGNTRLIRQIRKADPHLLLMTGDMLNATDDDGAVVIALIRSLGGRCPIYYSLGNHEQLAKQYAGETGSQKYAAFLESLETLGVILLDNARAELFLQDTAVELYGFTLPLNYYTGDKVENFLFERGLKEGTLEEYLGTPDPEALTILMAHSPKFFEEYREWGAHVTFSGHVHGGLIRIPGLGGLLAPQQGFFPEYSGGMYRREGQTLLVNRGKGSHLLNLRVNNRPHVVVADLTPGP
jgi:uncharacterized protein